MKRFAAAAVILGLLGLATTFVLAALPATDFLYVPHKASPLGPDVRVEGASPAGRGDIYFVDVYVKRASLLQQWLPFTRPDGSTLVPKEAYLPSGTSEEERHVQTEDEIKRSELIAPAVALRALGKNVIAEPEGALVISVASDVPAARVLKEGDVVVAVDGTPVSTPSDLRREIGRRKPGDDVRLTVRRGSKPVELTVRTVPNPVQPERPIVGIQVDQAARIKLPLKVNIDLGPVRGPSAGLPFALEIARQLGRNVTHGCKVAATGELALDGSVLPIGGVKQKTIGARRTGVDVFLVPAGENAAEAQRNADGLRIVPVESFQQALRQLTTANLKC
jgi:Lon-like protease